MTAWRHHSTVVGSAFGGLGAAIAFGHGADEAIVLDWIAQHLGARYRARARYMIGMLDAGSAGSPATIMKDALAWLGA